MLFKKDFFILDKAYRIMESIGDGSFGEIYTVEKMATRETLALKAEPADTGQK